MSGTPGVQPEDIAGLAAAAATMAAGIGASAASDTAARKKHAEQLANAANLLESDLGVGTNSLQRLQFEEMRARFKESRLYSRLFLLMITLFAIIFLWGGASLILGVTAAHVVTILASAVPAAGSALFKHSSNLALRRSDEAFKTLAKRVEEAEAQSRRESALARTPELEPSDAVVTLEAIKSIVPDATPEELASLINNLHISSPRNNINKGGPISDVTTTARRLKDINSALDILRRMCDVNFARRMGTTQYRIMREELRRAVISVSIDMPTVQRLVRCDTYDMAKQYLDGARFEVVRAHTHLLMQQGEDEFG
jgi:hypothetical protein